MIMPANGSRRVGASIFANKSSPAPLKTGTVSWSRVVGMHAKRHVRPSKDGPLLGGYVTGGRRRNADVATRSVIQLDVDTEGEKDPSGRIGTVTKQAPDFTHIRSGIDAYEWCAASSHWHEPQRGVIKYRITMLPDRDVQHGEWEVLLEALDELFRGALDRNAWQWSQAFYLPSCPAENKADAFFVHNQGAPLPVDEFVRRGRVWGGRVARRVSCPTASWAERV